MHRVTIAIRCDDGGSYAWIETRLPAGQAVSRRVALAALQRHAPGARDVRCAEQWHVPFRLRAFKVYFRES